MREHVLVVGGYHNGVGQGAAWSHLWREISRMLGKSLDLGVFLGHWLE